MMSKKGNALWGYITLGDDLNFLHNNESKQKTVDEPHIISKVEKRLCKNILLEKSWPVF